MRIRLLLSASLLLLFSATGLAQDKENNCDVKQLHVSTYDFVLKNLDSIKKHTPKAELITAELELTENGRLTKVGYYTAFGKKEQKEIKVWKGLETFVKENFSRCPDSHFYNGREHVLNAILPLPLVKADITKAKKQVESGADYIAAGTGKTEIPADSKFTVSVKSLTIKSSRGGLPYNITMDPVTKDGKMDYYKSKMVKLSDVFSIGFDVVKAGKNNYLKYTFYERVDGKSYSLTKESWRPIVNNKVNLQVKGIRDDHPGVRHITAGEEFDFDIQITFSK
ncbi:hypothetical protein ACX0HA_05420 [Flavobacterium hauense]